MPELNFQYAKMMELWLNRMSNIDLITLPLKNHLSYKF